MSERQNGAAVLLGTSGLSTQQLFGTGSSEEGTGSARDATSPSCRGTSQPSATVEESSTAGKKQHDASRNNCFLHKGSNAEAPKGAVKTQDESGSRWNDSPRSPANAHGQRKTTQTWTNQAVPPTVSVSSGGQDLTVVDGIDLQPVQLKQPPLDGDVADEVKSLHGSHSADAVLLLWQVPRLRSARARGRR